MKKKYGCIYCHNKEFNKAWTTQPTIKSELISSNLYGSNLSNSLLHKGISVKIKDFTSLISSSESDINYIKHIEENPGIIEIHSNIIGEKIFSPFNSNSEPLIIEMKINYCPYCGRKFNI